jgi:uncharacterized protein (DUF924 family)
VHPNNILHFWLEELTDKQHFTKDPALDADMRTRFGDTLEAASRCELFAWRATPEGRLAEILVLDQFSRNIFRDTPRAFAQDALALVLAQELVAGGHDQQLTPKQRAFAYMPYMHSESLAINERFGRYPHRNAILGRTSTPEELVFLNKPGSSF